MNHLSGGNSQQKVRLALQLFSIHGSFFIPIMVIIPKKVNSSSLSMYNKFGFPLPYLMVLSTIKSQRDSGHNKTTIHDRITFQWIIAILWSLNAQVLRTAPRAERELESLIVADPSMFKVLGLHSL